MKKGINTRIFALICAFMLAFCDVGSVLAENNVTLPVAEENEDGVVLPDDNQTEQPDDGTTETPDDGTTEEPEQPEHLPQSKSMYSVRIYSSSFSPKTALKNAGTG